MVHTAALATEATLRTAATKYLAATQDSEVFTARAPQVPLAVLDLALSYLWDYQAEEDPVLVAE